MSSLCLQKHAKGQDLLKKVCDHLNLLEEDYFGLAIWDTPTSRVSSCWCVVFCARVGSAPYRILSLGEEVMHKLFLKLLLVSSQKGLSQR